MYFPKRSNRSKKLFLFDTACEIAKKVQGRVVYDDKKWTKFDDFFKKRHFVHAIICHHVCPGVVPPYSVRVILLFEIERFDALFLQALQPKFSKGMGFQTTIKYY